MISSQLTEALYSFTKEEFREFGKFINSPFFNNRSEVIRFYNALKEFFPGFDSKQFTKENLFSFVYPSRKYSDVLMRKLVSLMTKSAMDYIVIKGFRKDELDYNVKLFYNLYERKMPYAVEKKAKLVEKLLNNSKHTYEYYEAKSKYTSWLTAYSLNRNESATIPKYQKELDDLIETFLAGMLINYNRLITFSKMYNVKYDLKFFEEVMNFLNKHDYRDSALISLYHNLILLSKSEDAKYFTRLRKYWIKFEDKLTDLEHYIIYVALYNYCINRKNKGESSYSRIQFEITKNYFSKKKIPEEIGYIQSNMFAAVVINAAALKEFKWVTEFIKNYSSFLDPHTAGESLNYAHSVIEFEKGSFERSLKYLSVINPERIVRKIRVKNIAIMNFYELNYPDELESALDAYRHFLTRKTEINPSNLLMSRNFLKFVTGLNKLRSNYSKDGAWTLLKAAEKSPYFFHKDWVLEKINELKK